MDPHLQFPICSARKIVHCVNNYIIVKAYRDLTCYFLYPISSSRRRRIYVSMIISDTLEHSERCSILVGVQCIFIHKILPQHLPLSDNIGKSLCADVVSQTLALSNDAPLVTSHPLQWRHMRVCSTTCSDWHQRQHLISASLWGKLIEDRRLPSQKAMMRRANWCLAFIYQAPSVITYCNHNGYKKCMPL